MGCVSSKRNRCRHCRRSYSPISRSYSMQVHHPPQRKGDSYHVVALTSSTLGSLDLNSTSQNIHHIHDKINGNSYDNRKNEEFRMGLVEAKAWSNIITERIPKIVSKTPTRTPPGEPETINAWELMEGLEDVSPLWSPNRYRSFSFDIGRTQTPILDSSPNFDRPGSKLRENGSASPKPLWLQLEEDGNLNSDSMASDFDPEVISSFRKSLQQLSPDHPFHLRPVDIIMQPPLASIESKKFNCWEEKKKDKTILYFTSLRGIRKTYEDCCHVRAILKAIGVRVDERDVSMHSGFKEELKELLQEDHNLMSGGSILPRVFIGSKHIGGAEEIRRLHEDGKLEKLLESCEKYDDGGGGGVCEGCGDIRFVPCETCSGSCKVYYEEEEEEIDEEEEEEECAYGFQRCLDCNENGLVRCPLCC